MRRALEAIARPRLIWVGWVGRKLWVTVPWTTTPEPPKTSPPCSCSTRPSVKRSLDVLHVAAPPASARLVGGSNIDSQIAPMGVLRNEDLPVVVRLDHLDLAADRVWPVAVWGRQRHPKGSSSPMTTKRSSWPACPVTNRSNDRYRTPWVTADWPTRKKSWRRADYICRISGSGYDLAVDSFRDYEERNVARRHTVTVPAVGGRARVGPVQLR